MILEIKDLKTYFYTEKGISRAVDGVSFEIDAGEVMGLAGESGCGKSLTALSILRLVSPPGKIISGEIIYNSENLINKSETDMRQVRGKEISIIFQEPQTSLNPVFTVGDQITESLTVHTGISKTQARDMAIDILSKVGIRQPEMRFKQYPHELSGGQQQRVMIAMALICNPRLLIADEPTTALDVTVQKQILELLADLQKRMNLSVIFISHDLSVLRYITDTMAIMYAGRIVEFAKSKDFYSKPLHPYTLGLFDTIPAIGDKKKRLSTIPGKVPESYDYPSGCRFHPRCRYKTDICEKVDPGLESVAGTHQAACHNVFDIHGLKH